MEGLGHLHVHSGYSARYGASSPDQLVARAAELAIPALALTDRDTVAGTVRFAKACARHGVRPIFGVDLAVAPVAHAARPTRPRTPVRGGAHVTEPPLRITLLAKEADGWAQLVRLVSAAHADQEAAFPIASWEALRAHIGGGLMVLLGPASEPARALSAGRADLAEQLLTPWRDVAGENLRLEAVSYGLSGLGPGSRRLAGHTLRLGDRAGVPVVLSNAARYATAGQHRLADVLDAARLLRPIPRKGPVDCGERYLKDATAMRRIAEEVAAAADAPARRAEQLLEETVQTAEACRVDPVRDLGLGRPHFPEPQVVGAGREPGDGMRLLRQRCEAGMVARGLDRDEHAMAQLNYELKIIGDMHFEGYFIAVAQVVADVRAMGIRVAARGSGAGSMVNHALFVATADPLKNRLLFERFLSPRRTSLPDIDLDVESARRLEVYDAIFKRFGSARVAVTGMPETYRARHALRDTGLALGLEPQTVDRIAKAFPHVRACDIPSALRELPELQQLAAEAEQFGPLWELAAGLDGLPRGYAMHPCGVIISNASLLDRLPVQPTPAGYPMLQADKVDVEDLGLLKLDVLGVRLQSAMAHAVGEIRRTTGRQLDLDSPDHVDLADEATFELIRSGRVLGCFNIESSGQQDLISRLQPQNLADIVADISLFRPGPVASGMPERFINARHRREEPHYPHPDLVPIMDDTYGVVIWHEQLIMIFVQLTGCDRAAGDVARRALADPNRLPRVETWFRQAATARGYSTTVTDEVWADVREFGAYGFCRAHALAFAVPAIQSAWLKTHHPAAFFAGVLEHDPGMWSRRILVQDARRQGVEILPVDVSASHTTYRVEQTAQGWGVRLALSTVRGISDAEAARIEAGQPYFSLQDLWQRARPSLPLAQRLIQIGALGELQGTLNRRDLLLQATELHRQSRNRTAADGQLPLGGDLVAAEATGLPEMTSRETLSAELEVLSVDLTHHLLEHHHRLLRELGATDAKHLQGLHHGQPVLVAGVKAATQTPPIPSGKRVIFATIEDVSGLVDLAFFEDSHTCAKTVFHSSLLLVRGTVEARRGNRRTVIGAMAWDLDEIAAIRRDHGPQAALDALGRATPAPTPAQTADTGRTLRDGTAGAKLHPGSDLQPAGLRSADLRHLSHRSPGSAG
ncbi:DNA polymerase III subunit alpha [Streptomyces sp. NBC_01304]|uniref:DNA polymerase III subunit alpha n=1 Tax=Streptomyces sp. NBC_01304 TaxID=2903818 RepID=UPI002E0E11F1|nr:DNA polymerase III subunit alpha [Streptomyces sp. NBC_01304]